MPHFMVSNEFADINLAVVIEVFTEYQVTILTNIAIDNGFEWRHFFINSENVLFELDGVNLQLIYSTSGPLDI